MTSRAVETSDFAFSKWHGCRGSRHMPTTSVSHGFGRLNRNGGISSSGHQSHHSKGGGSSPETSGDGLVHPRVGLPRFGDRWDKNCACLFVCLFVCFESCLICYFVCFWLKSSIWSGRQSQTLHVLFFSCLFLSCVYLLKTSYFFLLQSICLVVSHVSLSWRASPGKPNRNWCSTTKNWLRRRSRDHSWTGVILSFVFVIQILYLYMLEQHKITRSLETIFSHPSILSGE